MRQRQVRPVSSGAHSLDNLYGFGRTADGVMDALEPRQLLSGAPGEPTVMKDWGGDVVPSRAGSYVITFDDYMGRPQAELMAREVATRLGVTPTAVGAIGTGMFAWFETQGDVSREQASQLVATMPHLVGVQPDRLYQVDAVPNDTRFDEQYAMRNVGQNISFLGPGTAGADIHVTAAWDRTIGSRSVVVGVVDTGLNYNLPDLANNVWTNPNEIPGNGIDDDGNGYVDDIHGFDFGENDNDPTNDIVGHGTQVASCIGAVGNDGFGITGVNWNVSLMALKIADQFGGLTLRAIVSAHDYATFMRTHGINLVATNNSYGGVGNDYYNNPDKRPDLVSEEAAISRFIASGGVFVASAGNGGNDGVGDNNDETLASYPASFNLPGIISVAASDNTDSLAGFSNYGPETVDLAAPGVQILMVQADGSYAYNDGTSFSGPIVAGAVALLKAYKPNASATELSDAILNGVDQVPALQGKVRSGGRLNIARSMDIIGISGPVVLATNPGPVVGQINPSTGQPYNTVVVDFSKDIDPQYLNTAGVALIGANHDDQFGNGNDVTIPITSIARDATNPRRVVITLNLAGFAGVRLPVDQYRLTLNASNFRDTDGQYLNGNSSSGSNHVMTFRVVSISGDNEPNDTLLQATPIAFDSSGRATFQGITLGNGIAGSLDVDLYRIDLPRGAQISAEITAKRLASPSQFDSYLRLFDANGNELTANDQFFGDDSFLSFYVRNGGAYYVGVSGFANTAYRPTTAGSGRSQSTGVYNLSVAVALTNDDVVTLASTDPNLPRRIPVDPTATQGITTSTLAVFDSRTIRDVNLRLDISHTFDGDLQISLISPQNTEILMFDRRGGGGDNLTNTVFDDEATLSITVGIAPFTNTYRPESPLSGFDGQSGAGTWTLKINDMTGINTGFLNSWSLVFTFANDTFGANESNDTLATATQTNFVTVGSGAQTFSGFIGDGGFGSYDRDIFKFRADGGSSLSVVALPSNANGTASALDIALRVFDEQGHEVILANPSSERAARITNYVFASGGTYYLAVSEAANVAYNPLMAGDPNSRPAASTGDFVFQITLAAGVSDPATVSRGNEVSFGLDSGAGIGANDALGYAGLAWNGVEFVNNTAAAGKPISRRFFGASAGGVSFLNDTGVVSLPFTLTDQSDTFSNRISAKGSLRGLSIERVFSSGENDNFIAVDIYLRNTTTSTLTNVGFMEGFNPDPGSAFNEQRVATNNDVDPTGKFVSAKYTNNAYLNGLTIAMAAPASETRVKATVLPPTTIIRDPGLVYSQPINDPNGTSSDGQLVLAYSLGDMTSNQTAHVRYFIFFGANPTAVDAMYAAVNNGTGTGHLTADSASPATEVLQTGPGPTVTVPTLPYREYYPEGFYGDNIFTFLPISNPNDQATRVVVIARYEQGTRDQLVGELNIAANSRSGLTLVTPDLFRAGTALAGRVNPGGGVPAYALEIRSERPVAATFSHYDLNQVGGAHVAIGEAFTTRVSGEWTFGQVTKGGGANDFITFYNPNAETQKVIVKFYPQNGSTVFTQEFYSVHLDGSVADGLEGFRRGGLAINDIAFLPDGQYGVTVQCQVPIVSALSHFDTVDQEAAGQVGGVGLGALNGAMPEGQLGLNADAERIGVLNDGASAADVTFSFVFDNGSTYRTLLQVPASSHRFLDVQTLVNFPAGKPYAVSYASTQPVTVSSFSDAFHDGVSTEFADRAYTVWGFGEGFRPGDNDHHPGVVEYLRVYNPQLTDVTVEITISYDGTPGGESFRRTIPARRVSELSVDQFVTGSRRANSAWYSLTVKAPTPVLAYMGHYDRSFPGGFGTMGTPLGISQTLS